MKKFIVKLPIHIRILKYKIFSMFHWTTHEMEVDFLSDKFLLLKLDIGFSLMPVLKKMIKEIR